MRRQAVQCRCNDHVLVGTLHAASATAGFVGPAGIAMLLLNAGPAPRAGNSDLYAHICDTLAARGLPCFRFDLPGLGDSTGRSWPDIGTYWHAAQDGCNDTSVAILMDELCMRYALRGLIVGGLCAGAVCALRVADSSPQRVLGLLLLEPNFRTAPETAGQQSPDAVPVTPKRSRLRRLLNPDDALSMLSARVRRLWMLAPLSRFLDGVAAGRLSRTMPEGILIPTVLCLRRALERSIPALIVLADGTASLAYTSRILQTFPRPSLKTLRSVTLAGTNHILTAGDARCQTIGHVQAWIAERFPDALQQAPASSSETMHDVAGSGVYADQRLNQASR